MLSLSERIRRTGKGVNFRGDFPTSQAWYNYADEVEQLEAELADYKAGIEGMHDAIRDLRAENEMLRDRARQLRRIIEVNAPDVDIEYNLDALKEGG